MRNLVSFFLVYVFFSCCVTFSQGLKLPTEGVWHAEISLNDRLHLPFEFELSYDKKTPKLIIINGAERIELLPKKKVGDLFCYRFPAIDGELRIQFDPNGIQLSGEWINYNKAVPVTIPFTAYLSNESRFLVRGLPTYNYSGRWDVIFKDGGEHAIGVFNQDGNTVTGTFLTETGDYRYLAGNVDENNALYLSCFDGVHAYQFVANLGENEQINGVFYSGQSYQTNWQGKRNEDATLRDPDSLSQLINTAPFTFHATKLNGKPFHFVPQKNKGAVIQIMGSWCPNCIDETNYFKEIHAFYKERGIEFIAVSFENGKDKKEQLKRLKAFVKRCDVPYTVLLGGKKSADEALLVFSSLSKIMSFPTTIIIDKKGNVRRIHTGFSGPGTGQEYINYKIATEKLLDEISNEN